MTRQNLVINKIVLFCSLIIFLGYSVNSCGNKKKSHNDNPNQSEVQIVSNQIENGVLKLKYQSLNNPTPQYFCKVDEGEWYLCTNESQIDFKNKQTITFSVKDGINGIVTSQTFAFQGAPVTTESIKTPIIEQFGNPYTGAIAIGGNREFIIPEGMHITKYSTNYTRTGNLIVYEITRDTDKINGEVTLCEKSPYVGAEIVKIKSTANGPAYDYCVTLPRDDAYKFWNDYKLGFNTVVMASDNSTVGTYESISISVFDNKFDWQTHRSLFTFHCAVGKPGVWNRGYLDLPLENNYFPGFLPNTVRFEYCQKNLIVGNGTQISVWIGTFRSLRCGTSSEITEFVYMADTNYAILNEYQFARRAANIILQQLQRTQPANL